MDRLAKETFISIMSHLSLTDKINYALVCQSWYNTLKTTNLYSALVMGRNLSKFHNAIKMFIKEEHSAKQVIDLEIHQYGTIDPHSVLLMPKYFPNVKFLNWFDVRLEHATEFPPPVPLPNRNAIPLFPPEELCALELKQWSQLQQIKARNGSLDNGYFPFTIYLLGSSVFHNLTSLEFTFLFPPLRDLKQLALQGYRPLVESLIGNLTNTPAIECLTLRFLALELYDIECIHANAPTLHKLTLDSLSLRYPVTRYFSVGRDERLLLNSDLSRVEINLSRVEINLANNIKHLYIVFDESADDLHPQLPAVPNILQCLKYISQKYNNVNSLKISITGGSFDCVRYIRAFEQPIVSYISMDQQFVTLGSSNQAEHIKVLHFRDANIDMDLDLARLSNLTINICRQLVNLVELHFDGVRYTHKLLFAILQNCPRQLETLHFRNFDLKDNEYVNTDIVIRETSIKDLLIGLMSDDCGVYREMNQIIKLSLEACPLLEKFCCRGEYNGGPGPLNFNFLNHARLRYVAVDLSYISYYSFSESEKEGQCWQDYNTPFGGRLAIRFNHMPHVNLIYNPPIKLCLTKAAAILRPA